MHIIHVSAENAVENQQVSLLAKVQKKLGHTVEVFNPQNSLVLLKKTWQVKPDVLHFHGASVVLPLPSFGFSRIKRIWTMGTFSDRNSAHLFTAVTATQRDVQYKLLKAYSLQATYIPAGYERVTEQDEKLRPEWGVRKGQYCVTMADKLEDIQWIASAYNQLKTQKKLIVVSDRKRDDMHQLLITFPFLRIVETTFAETYRSLVRQAAVVISTSVKNKREVLLQAMDSSRAIIAVNDYAHTELLGTAAQYVQTQDVLTLRALLHDIVMSTAQQKNWGHKAQKRAQTYFDISRINREYMKLYVSTDHERVSVDSLVKTGVNHHIDAKVKTL